MSGLSQVTPRHPPPACCRRQPLIPRGGPSKPSRVGAVAIPTVDSGRAGCLPLARRHGGRLGGAVAVGRGGGPTIRRPRQRCTVGVGEERAPTSASVIVDRAPGPSPPGARRLLQWGYRGQIAGTLVIWTDWAPTHTFASFKPKNGRCFDLYRTHGARVDQNATAAAYVEWRPRGAFRE